MVGRRLSAVSQLVRSQRKAVVDVEIVFMWPWATAFYRTATTGQQIAVEGGMVGKDFLLGGMGIFFALLVFGLFYEWKRGAFEWD